MGRRRRTPSRAPSLAKLPERDALAKRMKELFYIEREGTPRHYGERWFIPAPRRRQGEDAIVYWREGQGRGRTKVLLDPDAWSADGSVSLGEWSVSWDGKKVALHASRRTTRDESTLYVMDVATGKKSDVDVIEGAQVRVAAVDGRRRRLLLHVDPADRTAVPVGRPPGLRRGALPQARARARRRTARSTSDRRPEDVPRRSTSRRTAAGSCRTTQHGWTRFDVEFMDLRAPKPAWQTLVVGARRALPTWTSTRTASSCATNDGAPRYRVFKVDPAHADRDAWTEIVPERADATLESVGVVGHKLAPRVPEGRGEPRRRSATRTASSFARCDLPTLGADGRASSGDPDDDLAYYSFQSFTYPTEIFETSIKTGKTTSWYKLKVPVEADQYEVEQHFATSKDGTRVPYFVVHAKDVAKDGKSPTILYGYGGFQVAQTPYFGVVDLPMARAGRGLGRAPTCAAEASTARSGTATGCATRSSTSSTTQFAVAEDLIKEGYTSPPSSRRSGGRTAGLLVGAAITQRPELFRVALCAVPLLDMVRYHLFGSGKTWIEEYGSADDAEDFKALYAYSPYHHVDAGDEVPGDAGPERRQRRSRRPDARPQVRRGAAVGVVGRPGAASRREALRPRRRRSVRRRSRRSPTSTRSRSIR